MSGHSKWSTIKHKKGAADAKRGNIFTHHAKLIEIAVREGGGKDPYMNPRLVTAIENAKADNVPNANIERAVKKGSGEMKGEMITEIVYGAYAPCGAACIIECLTDNKNRTLSSVRSIVEKRGGKWTESGSVIYMFNKKGVIIANCELNDDLELALMDAGAQDIEKNGITVCVTADANSWTKSRDALKAAGADILEAGLKYVAVQDIKITDMETAQNLMEFVSAIEDDDDVSEVYTNADISDEISAQMN